MLKSKQGMIFWTSEKVVTVGLNHYHSVILFFLGGGGWGTPFWQRLCLMILACLPSHWNNESCNQLFNFVGSSLFLAIKIFPPCIQGCGLVVNEVG
uniref:Putative ovule protein n=1 Tax=Solanum chacoense TaxID=4108 RepID=A0A0V0H916_SOLCH